MCALLNSGYFVKSGFSGSEKVKFFKLIKYLSFNFNNSRTILNMVKMKFVYLNVLFLRSTWPMFLMN